ncbi:MAG: PilZ domain-containing protein [Planctomycetes bacterium]|nr:PilZ domain-containing protein [Planctomycetota bacterium]
MKAQSHPSGECLLALDDRRTARLLELTGRQRAPILLSVRTLPDQEALKGHVVSVDSESIYVRLDEATGADRRALPTSCCDVTVVLGRERFHFETAVLGVIAEDERILVEMIRPTRVERLQRRRFERSDLHDSVTVHLREPDDMRAWCCTAVLLNVGRDGLACRVDRADADRLSITDRLATRFDLAWADAPFTFVATVRAKTPAGDAGKIILGLQFEIDVKTRAMQDRLACFLADLNHPAMEIANA